MAEGDRVTGTVSNPSGTHVKACKGVYTAVILYLSVRGIRHVNTYLYAIITDRGWRVRFIRTHARWDT